MNNNGKHKENKGFNPEVDVYREHLFRAVNNNGAILTVESRHFDTSNTSFVSQRSFTIMVHGNEYEDASQTKKVLSENKNAQNIGVKYNPF